MCWSLLELRTIASRPRRILNRMLWGPAKGAGALKGQVGALRGVERRRQAPRELAPQLGKVGREEALPARPTCEPPEGQDHSPRGDRSVSRSSCPERVAGSDRSPSGEDERGRDLACLASRIPVWSKTRGRTRLGHPVKAKPSSEWSHEDEGRPAAPRKWPPQLARSALPLAPPPHQRESAQCIAEDGRSTKSDCPP